jgi:hypothetical protein
MLTAKQKQALIALTKGVPPKEVAEALGLSLRTLQRWRTQPEFKAEVQRIESESGGAITTQVVESLDIDQLAAAAIRAASLMNRAIDFMEHTLNSPDSRTSDRLRVAQILGRWNGFEVDFERGLACLRRYGLIVHQDQESGRWEVWDQRWDQQQKKITPQK